MKRFRLGLALVFCGAACLAFVPSVQAGGAECPDTNGDGVVDVGDLINVITQWNTADPGADVTGDGVVNVEDLIEVILNWNAVCVVCGPGNGDCYEPNGTPGCQLATCCDTVCAQDAFCCDTSWDGICAGAALDLCGGCGVDDAGSCFEANGTIGCNDGFCCETVCAVDGFCCDNEWDGLCASEAYEFCGGCGDPGAGSCFTSNGTVGCNDSDCCVSVCEVDLFCCTVTWDGVCAGEAAELCAGCGEYGAGSCFQSNGTPGCEDLDCCQTVCPVDPFCCNSTWDSLCAGEAAELCAGCGESGAGSCYQSNDTPGCNDLDCCQTVCPVDPFCCNSSWDSLCAGEAAELCAGCGESGAGSCYQSNGSPGCNDLDCCQTVCPVDPFCCNNTWDSICAGEAAELCALCGTGEAGGCYESNGSPGCDDLACCQDVCNVDPFCCQTNWDGICAGEAAELCAGCGDAEAGSCFISNGTPGCDDISCCAAVCADDPFCCETSWDGVCASAAANSTSCSNSECPGAGSCSESNGTPGCDNAVCCNIVCELDPFCCDTSWDTTCANEAADNCSLAAAQDVSPLRDEK